jgi:hypothetical protein
VFVRVTQFILKFWKRLHETLDTHLNFSSAYYPQANKLTKRVNHILEDMLSACALQYEGSSNKSIPYAEFSYNDSYQESLKMTPLEVLYGRRCLTLLFWNGMREWKAFGPDVLQEDEEQVCIVRENLWIAQSRQKSYADHRRRELSFEVRGYVYLKVSPMRSLRCFKVRGNFSPRFIDPFKITKEREEELKTEFPSFFPIRPNLSDEIHFKGGRFVTPQNFQFWNVIKIR